MSQLRCNGKVPTIVFGKVARDIVGKLPKLAY